MSEELSKENSIGKEADSAVSSPKELLNSVQLDISQKDKLTQKTSDEIRLENGKRFADMRARMAKNLKEAEERGSVRAEEINLQRNAAYAEVAQSSDLFSPKETEPDNTVDLSGQDTCDCENDNKQDENDLTIKLGGSPYEYGDKCVIRVGTPAVTSYFFAAPASVQNAQSYASGPYGAAVQEKGTKVNKTDELFYNRAEQPIAYSAPTVPYEDRYSEYSEPSYEDFDVPVSDSVSGSYEDASLAELSTDNVDAVGAEDEYSLMHEDEHLRALGSDRFNLFEAAQLNKTISAFYKEEAACARKIQKIEAKQKDSDTEQNIALAVEKIALQKEICEFSVETLGACVYVSAKGKIARHEKILRTHINRYNRYCEEYEKYTGRPIHRLDYGMIEDTLSGRISRPIPNVYYYGAEGEAVYRSSDAENDRLNREENEYGVISQEYERYLADGGRVDPTPAERRAIEKQNATRISSIRRATERDILLVALRNEYRLESLEARRDVLVNSYGSDKGQVMKELRSIERTINKVRAASRRSIPIEREDNTRFYLLSALDAQNEKVKAGARRDRLASLRQRLEVLLSERESINERLIVLYGGSDKKLKKAKVNRKAAAVRRKSARKSFKRQADLARRIERFNVPSDMKEKAYALLNQKTAAVAKADELHYKISHLKPHGRARGELYAELKGAKKEIRRTDSEIRYMLRRLKKIQDRLSDRREFAVLFAIIAVFAVVLGIVWVSFGDEIIGYFKELYSKLRGL